VLHNDRELFEQAVLQTASTFGIEASIIEKDYFITLFLKEISKERIQIIFKGGTSLSKCHKLIKRFSEDIDLNIECETKPTQGQRKALKSTIISIIDRLQLTLINPDNIRSNRDFNKYIVDFPSIFESESLKPHLIVETAVYIRSYPALKMQTASMIYEFLFQNNFYDLIKKYDLAPFELKVQTAERTFVDKVYAIGDYYLAGKIREHSRHLYDLYKLLGVVKLDGNLKELISNVREDRKMHRTCYSVQDGIDMYDLLGEIISNDIYKEDYETITETLLFEAVPYTEVLSALNNIRASRLF